MKIFTRISNMINKTKSVYKRFPFSMVFICISAVFFIIDVINSNKTPVMTPVADSSIDYMGYGYMTFMLTVMALFLNLFAEALRGSAKDKEELKRFKYIHLGAFFFLAITFYGVYNKVINPGESLFSYDAKYVYFGVLVALIFACMYIGKILHHEDYPIYFLKILRAAFISLCYSLVLYLGIVAIFSAITHLFDKVIDFKLYVSMWIVIFLPFNVGVFLSNFPRFATSFEDYQVSKVFKILASYIIIPVFIVYLFILLEYFAKILITGVLPKGVITNLVLWFALLSVGLLFICTLIKDVPLVRIFRKIFPVVMLPVLGMMFLSIFIRVKEYGITENRFFVIMGGIFSTLSMVYYIGYRKNSNIFIPILFSVMVLISAVGPISAYNLSASSQTARLTKILSRNGMISNGAIVAKTDLPYSDKKEIIKIINYLSEDHRPRESKYLPGEFTFNSENLEKLLGFGLPQGEETYGLENDYNYSFDYSSPIDIKGYDRIIKVNVGLFTQEQSFGNYVIKNEDSNNVDIYYKNGNGEINFASFALKDVYKKMVALKQSKGTIDLEDLSIEGESNQIKYKIIFTEVYGYGPNEGAIDYDIEFYLLATKLE
ncbi:DUF4153 domain-containing protein [Peptoniphilus catoniae]|uniref:DUF4153 domain-containing protein n=1 Tax=Peptoniphilus catoniae TaxID=1660341 RepID=UPI0010FD09BB|nr:DUF4153 domain-containing protein [Peptoniphilus catoniae]